MKSTPSVFALHFFDFGHSEGAAEPFLNVESEEDNIDYNKEPQSSNETRTRSEMN